MWGLIQRQTQDADHRLMWAAFGHLADEGVPIVSADPELVDELVHPARWKQIGPAQASA